MTAIRDCRAQDHDEVVELSLRAWAPVFASVSEVLGQELSMLLHGADWREHQAREVRATLRDAAKCVWVADDEGRVVGFSAAAVVDEARLIGEIAMVAVDPAWHRELADRARRGVAVRTGDARGRARHRRRRRP